MTHYRRKLMIAAVFAVVAASSAIARAEAPKGGPPMYGLIGKMIAVAGQRDALIAIMLEGSGAMPGCRSYVIAKDPKNADAIWITEVWDDEQSHKASLSLPSVKQAIIKARPLIAGFGDYTVTEPVGGAGLDPR